MEIAICAIARLENRYIKEWVDYHLSLGFNHIYIYDNNRDGEEKLSQVIDIDGRYKDLVTLIPYHSIVNWPQIQAYEHCWKTFKFDWILYIDIDEFFTFGKEWKKEPNIQAFVNEYKGQTDAILINWMCYGDNGLQHYEDKSVLERFPEALPLNFSLTNLFGKQPENGHVKTLVCHQADFQIFNPHIGKGKYTCINAVGNEIENNSWQPVQTYVHAYIRHYVTKTISEYLDCKTKRSLADRVPGVSHDISSFFLYNKPTISKMEKYNEACSQRNIINKPMTWWIKQWIKHWIITPLFVK